jgi:hypothetical protein
MLINMKKRWLALCAVSLAACPHPIIKTPPPPLDPRLTASLAVEYQGTPNAPRPVALAFAGDDLASDAVTWKLELSMAGAAPVRTVNGEVKLVGGVAAITTSFVTADLASGVYTLTLTVASGPVIEHTTADLRLGPPERPRLKPIARLPRATRPNEPAGPLPFAVVLGNLHSQTNHSDGGKANATCSSVEIPQTGEFGPTEAYEFARTHDLDALVTSEHNHMYDGDARKLNPSADGNAIRATFAGGLQLADDYRKAHPDFIAIYGTEWGVISKGGHVNLFNPDGLVTWEKSESGDLYGSYEVANGDYVGLYEVLKAHNIVGQFNHPSPGNFAHYKYTPAGDEAMVTCEMGNSSAFAKVVDESSPVHRFETSCNQLLLAGFHVAPSSDQDNHCANWGAAGRNRTGVLLPAGTAPTLEAFITALRARRAYATEDKDSQITLTATIAGDQAVHIMGERLVTMQPVTLTVGFATAGARLPDNVVLVAGGVRDPQTRTLPYEGAPWKVTARPGVETFYYARITQDDGKVLWSAPIWLRAMADLPALPPATTAPALPPP